MKIIGGPMHGKQLETKAHWLIVPVMHTNNHPKVGKMIEQVKYERRKTPSGKEYLQFVEGYYEC